MREWNADVVEQIASAIAADRGGRRLHSDHTKARAALDEIERILDARGLRVVPVDAPAHCLPSQTFSGQPRDAEEAAHWRELADHARKLERVGWWNRLDTLPTFRELLGEA